MKRCFFLLIFSKAGKYFVIVYILGYMSKNNTHCVSTALRQSVHLLSNMEQLSGVLIKTGSWRWVWLPFALLKPPCPLLLKVVQINCNWIVLELVQPSWTQEEFLGLNFSFFIKSLK